MENIYLSYDGVIPPEEAAKADVRVFGASAYPNVVSTFKDFDSFSKWSDTLPQKDRLTDALRRMDLARELYEGNFEEIKAEQQAKAELVQSQVDELAQKLKLDPSSDELFLKATAIDADPLRGPVLHSAQLWSDHNCTGRRLDMNNWTYYANLGWLPIGNDTVSSVRVNAWTIAATFEHDWFRGQMTLFIGLWATNTYNMDAAINDTTTSAWCVGI